MLSVTVMTDGAAEALQESTLIEELVESTTIEELESTVRTEAAEVVAEELVRESMMMVYVGIVKFYTHSNWLDC